MIIPILEGLAAFLGKAQKAVFAARVKIHPLDKKHQNLRILKSSRYDMSKQPGEDYYLRGYLRFILSKIGKRPGLTPSPVCIDFGCGQGRVLNQLAKLHPRWKCVGLDLSPRALSRAQGIAQSLGLRNVEYLQQDLTRKPFLPVRGDILICNEVFFINPGWKKILNNMIGLARPGALFFCSWRPRLYYLASALKNRQWEDLFTVLRKNSGSLENSAVHFSWEEAKTVSDYLVRKKMSLLDHQGIGILSGLAGEPYEHILSPVGLSEKQRLILEKIDETIGKKFPDFGRYFMFCFRKSSGKNQ